LERGAFGVFKPSPFMERVWVRFLSPLSKLERGVFGAFKPSPSGK